MCHFPFLYQMRSFSFPFNSWNLPNYLLQTSVITNFGCPLNRRSNKIKIRHSTQCVDLVTASPLVTMATSIRMHVDAYIEHNPDFLAQSTCEDHSPIVSPQKYKWSSFSAQTIRLLHLPYYEPIQRHLTWMQQLAPLLPSPFSIQHFYSGKKKEQNIIIFTVLKKGWIIRLNFLLFFYCNDDSSFCSCYIFFSLYYLNLKIQYNTSLCNHYILLSTSFFLSLFSHFITLLNHVRKEAISLWPICRKSSLASTSNWLVVAHSIGHWIWQLVRNQWIHYWLLIQEWHVLPSSVSVSKYHK